MFYLYLIYFEFKFWSEEQKHVRCSSCFVAIYSKPFTIPLKQSLPLQLYDNKCVLEFIVKINLKLTPTVCYKLVVCFCTKHNFSSTSSSRVMLSSGRDGQGKH